MKTNDSIRFELKVVSLLCEFWAGSGFESKGVLKLEEKLLRFRAAIIASQKSGVAEDVPFEFLADDCTRVYPAIKYLEKCWKQQSQDEDIGTWLKTLTVPHQIGGEIDPITVNLPVPCPPEEIELLVERLGGDKKNKPSQLAEMIVGKRFLGGNKEVAFETVRKAKRLRKKEKARQSRHNLPDLGQEKKLLVSVLFDISSTGDSKTATRWRAKILDAIMTDYPMIGVYYLIKISNDLTDRSYLCDYDFSEIEKLYKHAYPNIVKGPFTKLLQA